MIINFPRLHSRADHEKIVTFVRNLVIRINDYFEYLRYSRAGYIVNHDTMRGSKLLYENGSLSTILSTVVTEGSIRRFPYRYKATVNPNNGFKWLRQIYNGVAGGVYRADYREGAERVMLYFDPDAADDEQKSTLNDHIRHYLGSNVTIVYIGKQLKFFHVIH